MTWGVKLKKNKIRLKLKVFLDLLYFLPDSGFPEEYFSGGKWLIKIKVEVRHLNHFRK